VRGCMCVGWWVGGCRLVGGWVFVCWLVGGWVYLCRLVGGWIYVCRWLVGGCCYGCGGGTWLMPKTNKKSDTVDTYIVTLFKHYHQQQHY
jgi:hypothetical protein